MTCHPGQGVAYWDWVVSTGDTVSNPDGVEFEIIAFSHCTMAEIEKKILIGKLLNSVC